jgi:hypothetical protein
MRALERVTLSIVLVALGVPGGGCVAAAPEGEEIAPEAVGDALGAWATQGTVDEHGNCNCNCNCGSTCATPPPPAPPPPAPPPPTGAPPIGPPEVAPPVGVPVGGVPIGGLPIGGVPIVGGCGAVPLPAPCAPCCVEPGLPSGFHYIVQPFTGGFLAIPGLRNCGFPGGGCGGC